MLHFGLDFLFAGFRQRQLPLTPSSSEEGKGYAIGQTRFKVSMKALNLWAFMRVYDYTPEPDRNEECMSLEYMGTCIRLYKRGSSCKRAQPARHKF